ncbi:MAG: aldehyde ferredoxin oxidoreductase N-terminal domain-containing protein [Desulfobacterales bacterium]|jgi:aldehyde:ferredoxin oxidoreductase
MIRDEFRVLTVDLSSGRGRILSLDGRDQVAGGSGLAALLFEKLGLPGKPWDDPEQPLIFAIGPLTGYFPLMSKTVGAFKSPYHDQYAESHAGGRSALALRFADLDALVITGRAATPSCLAVGNHHLDIQDVHYLWGKNVDATGKMLRRMYPGSGHRSILRIGPAGEIGSAMAGINVDTYRHFGRLGGGAVMGAKNLKGIVIEGDAAFSLPEGKAYRDLFEDVYAKMTATDMMSKYHNLGTAANLESLNALESLPWRNLQQTSDSAIAGVTGDKFADDTLLRNAACAGCPVGCIHLGFVREKFMEANQYLYRQVAYDYEPIFAAGTMLGITDAFEVLRIMDVVEKMGLDVMSAGVALAWATEATEKGLISAQESIVPLRFGHAPSFKQAVVHLGRGANDFYRLLSQGTLAAAQEYGGQDFACVLGQEMAGYATGEVYYAAQSLGFRHSHLDTGGYAYDQKHDDKDVDKAVAFLVADEQERVLLTSMVACLFARGVYKPELLAECLSVLGYSSLADNMTTVAGNIQQKRWQIRLNTGFLPARVQIPKRFLEVRTWKGETDSGYLESLLSAYGRKIVDMAHPVSTERPDQ